MTMLPSLFVSHGAPTFAIEPGLAGAQLRALGLALRKPKAILIGSLHWMTRGVAITAIDRPETVHDFGGFPPRALCHSVLALESTKVDGDPAAAGCAIALGALPSRCAVRPATFAST